MSDTSLSDLARPERIQSLSPASLSNLPSCLKSLTIWYPFRFTPRAGDGFGKPPCDRQGNFATWSDASTRMSFDDAYGLQMDGVGIMLHEALGLLGIDFDHCVKDGEITDPWVAEKVKELDSYRVQRLWYRHSCSGLGPAPGGEMRRRQDRNVRRRSRLPVLHHERQPGARNPG